MIVGERILEVSGNKTPLASIKSLGINIQLEDVKMGAENLVIFRMNIFIDRTGDLGKPERHFLSQCCG